MTDTDIRPPSPPPSDASYIPALGQHRRIAILYGSQSGCAAEVAERIALDAHQHRFTDIHLTPLDQYNINLLPTESLLVIVTSTQGQGEPPDNAKKFYRFLLRKDLPSNCLNGVYFTLFAMGDSSYPIYNACGRRIYQRLLDLGARSVYPRGLGDDQAEFGYEEGLSEWKDELWRTLRQRVEWLNHTVVETVSSGLPPTKYQISVTRRVDSDSSSDDQSNGHTETSSTDRNDTDGGSGVQWYNSPSSLATLGRATTDADSDTKQRVVLAPYQFPEHYSPTPIPARMLANHRLTPANHFQDVRHIAFDLTDSAGHALSFEPGDVVELFPRNDPSKVRQLIEYLGYRPTDTVTVTALPSPIHYQSFLPLSQPLTLQELFECYLDILGKPNKNYFAYLSHFTEHELHREKLLEFSTTLAGTRELFQYCYKEYRNHTEVLYDFHTVQFPSLSDFINVIPMLRPRQFSIANSQLYSGDRLEIVVAMVSKVTPFKRQFRGVCSQFVALLPHTNNDSHPVKNDDVSVSSGGSEWPMLSEVVYVPIRTKKGSFRVPPAIGFDGPPAVLIGPGTGVAPFRAMIQHKHTTITNTDSTSQYSDYTLFFGNRNAAADYFYRTEWARYHRSGALNRPVVAAFSRDQDSKYYIQHAMTHESQASLIYDLVVRQRGYFFVAGSSGATPREIRRTLSAILTSEGGMSDEEAQQYVRQMEKDRRYIQEVW